LNGIESDLASLAFLGDLGVEIFDAIEKKAAILAGGGFSVSGVER